jgi:hypothetical protein
MNITKSQLIQIIKEEISGVESERNPRNQSTDEEGAKLKKQLESNWKYMQWVLVGGANDEPGKMGLLNEWANGRMITSNVSDLENRYSDPIQNTRRVLEALVSLRKMSPAVAQAEQDLVKLFNGIKETESKLVQLIKNKYSLPKEGPNIVEMSKRLTSQANSDLRPHFERAFALLVKGGLMAPQGIMAKSGN